MATAWTLMTMAEAAKATRKSESWLWRHCCGLCEQNAAYAIRYGCGSIYGPRCTQQEIIARIRKIKVR